MSDATSSAQAAAPVAAYSHAVAAGDLVACIRSAGGELVSEVEIFDVYSGDQVGDGKVSLAVHVEFRDPERTLTDEDVAPLREKIVSAVQGEFGGELRG